MSQQSGGGGGIGCFWMAVIFLLLAHVCGLEQKVEKLEKQQQHPQNLSP